MAIGPSALASQLLNQDNKADFNSKEPLVGLYLLHYRHPAVGNHILTKNFRFNGSLREARERAEKHCSVLGLKMMFVEPLICDLKKDEDMHLGVTIQSNLETALESKEVGK